mmetsp:Transcript_10013/g.18210  ORF Transcript_10013/g.18210 Transcript_10013/m.18210 type:complete len:225 (+) Transcript_10013:25-699(+)
MAAAAVLVWAALAATSASAKRIQPVYTGLAPMADLTGAVPPIPILNPLDVTLGQADILADTTGSKIVEQVTELPSPFVSMCNVRPQTIIAIQKLRAKQVSLIGQLQERAVTSRKRKEYVQGMTAYINARIMEMNKVKEDLEQELKWMEVTKHHVEEITERQKLMKLQDVSNCISKSSKGTEKTASKGKEEVEKNLKKQIDAAQKSIDDLKKKMSASLKGGDKKK